MKIKLIENIDVLMKQVKEENCIQILCNEKQNDDLLEEIIGLRKQFNLGFSLNEEKSYERMNILQYLRFFKHLYGSKHSLEEALIKMKLSSQKHKCLRKLDSSTLKKVTLAREILRSPEYYFLQTPLSKLNEADTKIVIQWIEEERRQGKRFLITTYSMTSACLIPSDLYSMDQHHFSRLDEISQEDIALIKEVPTITKIQAKIEDRLFLLDPQEIDYIESENSISVIHAKGSRFQSALALEELEKSLKRFGFFRCHRSYIVNMQKVQEINRWTRNSYSLKLNDAQPSSIPLSKGRVDELKRIFGLEI